MSRARILEQARILRQPNPSSSFISPVLRLLPLILPPRRRSLVPPAPPTAGQPAAVQAEIIPCRSPPFPSPAGEAARCLSRITPPRSSHPPGAAVRHHFSPIFAVPPRRSRSTRHRAGETVPPKLPPCRNRAISHGTARLAPRRAARCLPVPQPTPPSSSASPMPVSSFPSTDARRSSAAPSALQVSDRCKLPPCRELLSAMPDLLLRRAVYLPACSPAHRDHPPPSATVSSSLSRVPSPSSEMRAKSKLPRAQVKPSAASITVPSPMSCQSLHHPRIRLKKLRRLLRRVK